MSLFLFNLNSEIVCNKMSHHTKFLLTQVFYLQTYTFQFAFDICAGPLLCLPPGIVGRHIVFPLHPSVCLSVTESCLLYNLITVRDI